MSNVIQMCKVQQYAPIAKLKFHPENPRTIKPERLEALKESITEKGFYQPILVWKKGGIVLAGNHRLLAAQQLIDEGWEFRSPSGTENVLPVVIEDVSEDVAESILFETNNTYADWVEDKLKLAIDEAEKAGRSIQGFGFTQEYLDNLLEAATKDADETLSKLDKELEESEEATKLRDSFKEEEFDSIIMPKHLHEQFTTILQRVSKAINPDWKGGDAYTESLQVICQALNESGLLEEIEGRVH